jgi:hypothetical protein
MCKDLFMAFAQKEIGRVRNELKRPFPETEKVFVHLLRLSPRNFYPAIIGKISEKLRNF